MKGCRGPPTSTVVVTERTSTSVTSRRLLACSEDATETAAYIIGLAGEFLDSDGNSMQCALDQLLSQQVPFLQP